MSATLYVLVVLQGTTVSLSAPATPPQRSAYSSTRGRTLLASRMTQASAPGQRSLSFRKAALGQLARLASEDECKRYIGAFKDGIPTACRQLAMPVSCSVACVAPVPAPPPAAKPVEPRPDKPDLCRRRCQSTPPASLPANGIEPKPSDIQVGGKQYTKVAGLTWVERIHKAGFHLLMFRWGRTTFRAKISPLPCRRRLRKRLRHRSGSSRDRTTTTAHPSPCRRSSIR